MRDQWLRQAEIDSGTVAPHLQRLMAEVFNTSSLNTFIITRLSGGLSNTNFKIEFLDGSHQRAALFRLWQRDPEKAPKEVSLLRFLSGRGFAPEIYAFEKPSALFEWPSALLEWVPGESLNFLCRKTMPTKVGFTVGKSLAEIHKVTFDRQGFFDDDLNLSRSEDFGSRGLVTWIEKCLSERAGSRLGYAVAQSLIRTVRTHSSVLDCGWARSPTLTHGDFNPSNIILRKQAGKWTVSGIIDWEFGFSGGPTFDFGNILRPPIGEDPRFRLDFLNGYREGGGDLPQEWNRCRILADLVSWIDFLNMEQPGATLVADASNMIQKTIDWFNVAAHSQDI